MIISEGIAHIAADSALVGLVVDTVADTAAGLPDIAAGIAAGLPGPAGMGRIGKQLAGIAPEHCSGFYFPFFQGKE